MSAEWLFLVALNERLRPLRDPVQIQEVAVRLIGEHLQASRVNYAQIEGNALVIKQSYARGVPPFAGRGDLARFGKTIVDACRRGETVVISDVQADARFTDAERAQLLASEIAAFVGVPLTKEGRWIATFGVHSATPRTWTRDQIALVEVTADYTWSAGERARVEEALSLRDDRQAFLRKLNDAIPRSPTRRAFSRRHAACWARTSASTAWLREIEGDDCTIVSDYVDGLPSLAGRFRWTDLGSSRTEEILKGGTLFVNDTSIEPHSAAERDALHAAGIAAYICPLLIKDGRFVASFGIHSREPRVWTPEEVALVQDVADRIWADARAPQCRSRAAYERRAAGVPASAQRRASAAERSR
jgi:GAF domain-containing protein